MWNEKGSVLKDPGGKLNVALVFPGTYWVGMSNLGLQQMYRLLNAHPGILCERFFTDCPRSVEANRPLSDFHIIAFSISYEMDFIEVVRILAGNTITVSARQRNGRPIVMAGGAAVTMNPEPLADACDICFLGDGETLPEKLHGAFSASSGYEEFLDRMSSADGVYVPGRTRPVYEGDTVTSFEGPLPRLSLAEPLADPARTSIVTKDTAFGDMYLVETARGCPFSCAFCSAREIYSPYRSVSVDRLCTILDEAAGHREKIGLVSTSLNNHPEAAAIFSEIRRRGLKVAPPSLRPGMIGPELLTALSESGVKGVTLAPETGSEDLRFSAGKRIKNETILDDVRSLVTAGVRDIKLYLMVGLPGEKLSDLDETIDLIRRIRQIFIQVSRGNRKIGKVSVSVNTFVPKPHTPFERKPMVDPEEAKSRIKRIEKGLRAESNTQVGFEGPKWAYLQALISRGDRRLLGLLKEMAGHDASSWHRTLKRWPLNPDYYALRAREESEILPWSFLRGPCRGGNIHAG
ncbi:MAG TPA: radical SAM protein [Deltaproteobacteria bacterium]|nr:radical SAM protein [Deltaproteobacteria bacterium]HPR55677.1 radical SAM protein [Deltaproteobacteria bacterium]